MAPSKKVTSVLTLDTAVVSVDRGTWLTSFGAVGLGLDIFEQDNRAQLKICFCFSYILSHSLKTLSNNIGHRLSTSYQLVIGVYWRPQGGLESPQNTVQWQWFLQ